jgi:hypothetical protein
MVAGARGQQALVRRPQLPILAHGSDRTPFERRIQYIAPLQAV